MQRPVHRAVRRRRLGLIRAGHRPNRRRWRGTPKGEQEEDSLECEENAPVIVTLSREREARAESPCGLRRELETKSGRAEKACVGARTAARCAPAAPVEGPFDLLGTKAGGRARAPAPVPHYSVVLWRTTTFLMQMVVTRSISAGAIKARAMGVAARTSDVARA